jgi:hypothetical protein
MEKELRSRQQEYTRRVESHLRRKAVVTAKEADRRVQGRMANDLEDIVTVLYHRVSNPGPHSLQTATPTPPPGEHDRTRFRRRCRASGRGVAILACP